MDFDEDGKTICPDCKGAPTSVIICPTCLGAGKLDWIEVIRGKESFFKSIIMKKVFSKEQTDALVIELYKYTKEKFE